VLSKPHAQRLIYTVAALVAIIVVNAERTRRRFARVRLA